MFDKKNDLLTIATCYGSITLVLVGVYNHCIPLAFKLNLIIDVMNLDLKALWIRIYHNLRASTHRNTQISFDLCKMILVLFCLQGNIEELFSVDIGLHAIAAANDCDRRLGDYVNIDVVNAIQRTAAKTWVSDEPYNKDACTLDFNLLLFNTWKLDQNLMEAILWWTKVLNLKDKRYTFTTFFLLNFSFLFFTLKNFC